MQDKNFLRDILTPAEDRSLPDTEAGLPRAMEQKHEPYSRPSNKPVYALHILSAANDVRSFQYIHLDSNSGYSPDCITLNFVGLKPVKLSIQGRNLWQLYDYIHQHRMPWIAESDDGFTEDGKPLVTKVVFEEVTEDA